jgi:hypothetical protein
MVGLEGDKSFTFGGAKRTVIHVLLSIEDSFICLLV